MVIHNGFYMELDELLQEYPESDFGFLQNIDVDLENINIYDFLHGYCFEFSMMLHKIYKYPAYMIKDEEGRCIHCFCTVKVNNSVMYIDVRGITDNYKVG